MGATWFWRSSTKPKEKRTYIYPLKSDGCTISALVGSKAAQLAKLALQGFPVPEGYAITVKAFKDFCAFNNITLSDGVPARDLIEAILNGEFPIELMDDIEHALDNILSGQYAIRSSAMGEDGFTDSLAGQLQTFLCVPREHIKTRIKECWAALFNTRVMAYRLKRQLPLTHEMGVIIQKQIQPVFAGVLFSIDPHLQTADRMVIEWVQGLGEQLVSGEVTPDRLHLYRKNPIFPKDLDKSLIKSLEQLVELSLEAERLLRYPLDIEWCVESSGVYILQARPITALMSERITIWSNVNIGENYPQPLSPFTWSVVESFRFGYFQALFRSLGLPESALDEAQPVTKNLIGVQGGVVYYNLSNWYEMLALFPMSRWSRKFLDHYIGQQVPLTYIPKRSKLRIFREHRYIFRRAWFWLHVLFNYLTLERQVKNFERNYYAHRKSWRSRSLGKLTLEEIEELLSSIVNFLNRGWGGAALADFSAMVFPGLLEATTSRWLADSSGTSTARLLQGLAVKSTEPLKMIWKIAQEIGERPVLKSLLLAGDYATLELSLDQEVQELVDNFMERFGGRCYHELMITSPTFEERTDLFWDLLKGYSLSPDKDLITKEHAERKNRKSFTRQCLRGIAWVHRPVFLKVLKDAQRAIEFRERARLCQSLIYGDLRRTALEIGKRLVDKRYLSAPEDIFYLEVEELHQFVEGKFLYPETIPLLVDIRKKSHTICGAGDTPEFFILDKGDYLKASRTKNVSYGNHRILKGTGVSRGRVQGRARIILNPVEQNRLEPGEILVARATDPGWTPLFLIAGGLILEKGGLLSHGAIVAREFGIPAVVGVIGATQYIVDGQPVAIDGDTGEVLILVEDEGKC